MEISVQEEGCNETGWVEVPPDKYPAAAAELVEICNYLVGKYPDIRFEMRERPQGALHRLNYPGHCNYKSKRPQAPWHVAYDYEKDRGDLPRRGDGRHLPDGRPLENLEADPEVEKFKALGHVDLACRYLSLSRQYKRAHVEIGGLRAQLKLHGIEPVGGENAMATIKMWDAVKKERAEQTLSDIQQPSLGGDQ